ncbi:MAG: zinc ribbon domain-containing protein [Candidatus Omnitrophica bacterium]|nr:zinc ribbon domain-containing protein [Candidatus Omnitrophota bacterium]MCM8808935.1 zinc ribbon domain-containing protein [Candidatus Omnitrophota bacterium]MCM8810118.1 zinc ribbon domain-containing protein [Candidatus Omnitrophota bacterium]
MPTYEYECKNCGYKFEKFQKMTEDPLKICPQCKNQSLRRLVGIGGGIIYKGPGFYTTEYRSEEYKRKQKEEESLISKTSSSNIPSSSSDKTK